MKESTVQKWVKDQVINKYPTCFIFKVAQGRYSSAGIPDLVSVINGKFVAIEIKTDHGKLTKLQSFAMQNIKSAGGISHVIYGKNIDQLNKLFEEIDVISKV